MIRRSVVIGALALLPSTGRAQGTIPSNPLYLSITGPNAEPQLYHEVSLSSYQLLSAAVEFSDKDSRQKVTFAPFKLSEVYRPILSETLINLAQKGGVTTFGIGSGWTNAAPAGRQAQKWLETHQHATPAFRVPIDGESDKDYEAARQSYKKRHLLSFYNEFYETLDTNAVHLTVGANLMMFPTLFGDDIDVNEDGVIDNHFTLKGYDFSAGLTYLANPGFGLNGVFHQGRRRGSSKADSDMATYRGFSAAIGVRVAVLDEDYKTSTNYLKNLFVPSIVLGASLEYERCIGEGAACEDNLRRQTVVTPFVDIKIKPETQFRIAFPIRDVVAIGGVSKGDLAAVIQVAVQLSSVK